MLHYKPPGTNFNSFIALEQTNFILINIHLLNNVLNSFNTTIITCGLFLFQIISSQMTTNSFNYCQVVSQPFSTSVFGRCLDSKNEVDFFMSTKLGRLENLRQYIIYIIYVDNQFTRIMFTIFIIFMYHIVMF